MVTASLHLCFIAHVADYFPPAAPHTQFYLSIHPYAAPSGSQSDVAQVLGVSWLLCVRIQRARV